jgi:hypothetical protein
MNFVILFADSIIKSFLFSLTLVWNGFCVRYLAMLRKAAKENIVADLTNLYDHFFVTTGESKAKVTAARLPYFDGDYWPGAAEDLIYQMRQEEDGRKQNKKGTTKKTITKRALKATGQSDLSGNASKDLLLMHKVIFYSISFFLPFFLLSDFRRSDLQVILIQK